MPIYEYECSNCHHRFEIRQSFIEEPLKICDKCNKDTLEKVLTLPIIFVKLGESEIKTLGHLAHRHTENMSNDELEKKKADLHTKKEAGQKLPTGLNRIGPIKKSKSKLDKYKTLSDTEVGKLTPTQQKNYIEKGIK